MGYATISQFRRLTNFKTDLVSDVELLAFFAVANRLVNKLISTKVHNEQLFGNINGSNTLFYTQNPHICDTNLKNILVLDSCDDITGWTKADNADNPGLSVSLVYGSGAITLPKNLVVGTAATWSKALSSAVDGTGRKLKISLFIKDTRILSLSEALTIRVGNDSSNYYSAYIGRNNLKNGINVLEFELDTTDMGLTGTVDLTALDYLYISYNALASASTVAAGEIIMDYWRLEDIDSPDSSDVKVYYVTKDANNFPVYGSAKAVSEVLSREGRITVTTAPTTTTAPLGVYADYAYTSKNTDWNFVNTAACYMAAHLVSFKITGNAPNYAAIQDSFSRRDLAGAPDEWLRLCFSMLISAVGEGNDGIGFRRIETRRQF